MYDVGVEDHKKYKCNQNNLICPKQLLLYMLGRLFIFVRNLDDSSEYNYYATTNESERRIRY